MRIGKAGWWGSAVVVLATLVLATGMGWGQEKAAARGEGQVAPKPDVSRTLALAALPKEMAEYKQAKDKIHGIKVTFEFKDEPVADAVDLLADMGKVNVVLDASMLADPNQVITLKLTNVALDTALDFFVEQLGMKWDVRGGVVYISNEEGVRRLMTAVYNVKDLMSGAKTPRGAGEPAGEEVLPSEALVMLIDLIKQTVEPGTWEEGSGNAIQGAMLQGCMVVTHNIAAHEKVQEMLELLRKARDLGGNEAGKK